MDDKQPPDSQIGPQPDSHPSQRRPLRRRPRVLIVPLIIALNAAVFILWKGAERTGDLDFMAANFLVSWNSVTGGAPWTLLTAAFSHNMFWHICINMFVLNSFGSIMELVLGRKTFLLFYLLAGIVSSACHAWVSDLILHNPALPALGASGAIAGVVLVFALMFPKERILLLGIIPIPAIFGALAFIAIDLYGLHAQAEGGGLPIGHGAHLGGALAGILFYFFYIRPRSLRQQKSLP